MSRRWVGSSKDSHGIRFCRTQSQDHSTKTQRGPGRSLAGDTSVPGHQEGRNEEGRARQDPRRATSHEYEAEADVILTRLSILSLTETGGVSCLVGKPGGGLRLVRTQPPGIQQTQFDIQSLSLHRQDEREDNRRWCHEISSTFVTGWAPRRRNHTQQIFLGPTLWL